VEGVTDKPEPRRLVSVRAVAAESTSVRGRWVLPSVEVWSDSVDIHVVWPETGLDSASHIEYALSDDLGTKYEVTGGMGGGGDGSGSREQWSFAPTLPPGAGSLTVSVLVEQVIFDSVTVELGSGG
jgi:hypothetical protein